MEKYIHIKRRLLLVCLLISLFARSQETRQLSVDKPQAIVDLKSIEGAALINAKWYVQPAYIIVADFKSPGSSLSDKMLLYPTGMNIKTHTMHP